MGKGIFRKYYGFCESIQVQWWLEPDRIIKDSKWLLGTKIPLSSIKTCEGMSYTHQRIGSKIEIHFCADGKNHTLYIRDFDSITGEDINGVQIYNYIIDHSGMSDQEKAIAKSCQYDDIVEHASAIAGAAAKAYATSTPTQKDASVVGRAVVGGIVAGPAGAVVGALSAVDKNNKNKK